MAQTGKKIVMMASIQNLLKSRGSHSQHDATKRHGLCLPIISQTALKQQTIIGNGNANMTIRKKFARFKAEKTRQKTTPSEEQQDEEKPHQWHHVPLIPTGGRVLIMVLWRSVLSEIGPNQRSTKASSGEEASGLRSDHRNGRIINRAEQAVHFAQNKSSCVQAVTMADAPTPGSA
ncbi:hypothetical protein [uncultured Desulfuromonas sp.]|uniref:hypothetical protein n=1 Tax=uncultured Desulfuromonas sp. TaxID=181013 RepID=UPI002AABA4FB|nr:hypothetical protein [uncultured Desulfuromonas sp.]